MNKDKKTSSVYNILAFRFAGRKAAEEAIKQIKASGALAGRKIAAQVAVEQDENGKVHVHEPGRGGVGAGIGAGSGALLALIGGPAGLLTWAVAGSVLGGVAGHYLGRPIAKGDLKEIGEALTPDTSFLLLLLEDKEAEDVIKSMEGYSADVVTLTVGDELSGEIASFVAGTTGDPQGNTIAGVGGMAADAAGNVVAGGDVVVTGGDDNE